jgi:hypothetical protein
MSLGASASFAELELSISTFTIPSKTQSPSGMDIPSTVMTEFGKRKLFKEAGFNDLAIMLGE